MTARIATKTPQPPLSYVTSFNASIRPPPQCCGNFTAGEEPCGPLNWLPGNGGPDYAKCDPAIGGQQTPINLDINEEGYSGLGKGSGLVFEAGKCSGEVEEKTGTWEVAFFDCDNHGQDGFYVTAKGACVRAYVWTDGRERKGER